MKRLILPLLLLTTLAACNKNGDQAGVTSCKLTGAPYVLQLGGANLQLPNAFTPNGDGRNDYFRPVGAAGISSFGLAVYDHDGSVLFDTQDQQSYGWDGTKTVYQVADGYYSVAIKVTTTNGRSGESEHMCGGLPVWQYG